MILLYTHLQEAEAQIFAAVLAAEGLTYHIEKLRYGWGLWVEETQLEQADYAIERYAREEHESQKHRMPIAGPRKPNFHFESGLWAAGVLLAIYMAVNVYGNLKTISMTYGAAADRILDGEVYRTVTALLLHANAFHLLGNMATLILFGGAVAHQMGYGVGWAAIVLAGSIGNLVNAWFYQQRHLSIGASTAVFAALGILITLGSKNRFWPSESRFPAWIRISAGIALLGMLGASALADVMAHLFGFLAGLTIGGSYAILVKHKRGPLSQAISLCLTIGVLVVCWWWGRS